MIKKNEIFHEFGRFLSSFFEEKNIENDKTMIS